MSTANYTCISELTKYHQVDKLQIMVCWFMVVIKFNQWSIIDDISIKQHNEIV